MSAKARIKVTECSKDDTLNLVKLSFQTSVMISLCTDMCQHEDELLKFNFKTIVERDLQNVGENFSDNFLTNIEAADEQATLNLLKMYYDFNRKIKVKDNGKDYTNAILMIAYCASIFRTINKMSYKDNKITTLKNICHKAITTFNRQHVTVADIEYNEQNLLITLTEALVNLTETIKYN